ncbi:MAG: glutaredoxin [Acidobacteria bacterium]|nr:MAG: glutaredoxin [Acidobacteriota bacterium]REK03596.1 MAG: glutaredoxin [Acidobacteriota bacterium]
MIQLYYDPRCPFCQHVLQYLEDNEIPFEPKIISLSADSPTKRELVRLGGKAQVPFLVDPENGVEMYESGDIVAYLERL